MNDPILMDLFVEDRAHEEFLTAIALRLAREENKDVKIRVRSARGGHGRVLSELQLYQKSILNQLGIIAEMPDILLVAIDANCKTYNVAKKEIEQHIDAQFKDKTIIACPDPHIERWYLADVQSVTNVIGRQPKLSRKKCERDYYKTLLADTIMQAGHPPTLGGIEFARELVDAMDFYRAGKAERSLQHFLNDALKMMRLL